MPGLASATRKELDELTEFARQNGAKGLVTLALLPEGPRSPLTRFLSPAELEQVISRMGGQVGDLILFVADAAQVCNDVLSRLRSRMAEEARPHRPVRNGPLLGDRLSAAGDRERRRERTVPRDPQSFLRHETW